MCLPLSHPLSSPFPFPLCVSCHVIHPHVCVSPFPCLVLSSLCVCEARHMHCVCAACHTPTLCPAVLLPLLSSLSVSLPPPSPSFLGASERERSVGKEERGRREVCHPKRHAKRQHKHSKKKTTPGVPTLSPTLVQTTPFHPSLHSSHHKSCFPLGVAVTVSPKAHTRFPHQHKR